jgi:hypothetical protein
MVVPGFDGLPTKSFWVATDGRLWLSFKEMRRVPPFDQDEVLLEFIRRLGAAANMPVDDGVIEKAGKAFPMHKLSLPAVLAALDAFVEQAATGDATG